MMKKPRTRKTGLFRVILLLVLCAAVILAVAFVIARSDGLSIKQMLRGMRRKNAAAEYHYENASDGAYGAVGGGFAALSRTELRVFDVYGGETLSEYLSFAKPVLSSAGKYGAAYDAGGSTVLFFSASGVISKLTFQDSVISASVNDKGYLAVCTKQSGWGGTVTVYNRRGSAIYKWSSGSAYVLSASVRGGSDLLAVTVGSSGGGLVLLRLSSEEEKARWSSDGIILDARFMGERVAAVTESSLVFLDDSLGKTGEYAFPGKYLTAYDLSGSGAVVVTGEHLLGGSHTVAAVDTSGHVTGSLDAESDVISVGASGSSFAVLYSGSLEVYTMEMTKLASFDEKSGADAVLVRSDSTVVAAGPYSAYVHTFDQTASSGG